jgi:hypothetical protein
MVVNLDGDRYMFTLEFVDNVTYENLVDFFELGNVKAEEFDNWCKESDD